LSGALASSEPPLSVDTVIDYLLARRIIGFERILNGDLSVIEAPSRNRNLVVQIGEDRGYVIKQPEPVAPSTAETLACEAQFYQHNHDDDAPLSDIVAKFVAFDAIRSILTLELVPGHTTLSEICAGAQPHEFPIALWRRLGEIVARVHNNSDAEALPSSRRSGSPPWAFHAHRPATDSMRSQSQASLAALLTIQSTPALLDCLALSVLHWDPSVLIHGDLRLDNVLVPILAAERTSVKLIDWELCQRGDPVWDAAWIVAGLVRLWLHTIKLGDRADQGDSDSAIEQSNWSVYQAAIRSFFFGFSEAHDASIAAEKLARFTVVRLVQSVLESSQYARHLGVSDVLSLQLCENIAVDPQRAADDFFALGVPDLKAS
jgi:aminoglycoside phosphotransferase (APT) family kinase protein